MRLVYITLARKILCYGSFPAKVLLGTNAYNSQKEKPYQTPRMSDMAFHMILRDTICKGGRLSAFHNPSRPLFRSYLRHNGRNCKVRHFTTFRANRTCIKPEIACSPMHVLSTTRPKAINLSRNQRSPTQ